MTINDLNDQQMTFNNPNLDKPEPKKASIMLLKNLAEQLSSKH